MVLSAGLPVVRKLQVRLDALVRKTHHELIFQIGTLVHYQSTSYWDSMTILYPGETHPASPVIIFDHTEPSRTHEVNL